VFVNSWVYGGSATEANVLSYDLTIPTAGTYVFETSGAIGACGYALELNTLITVLDASSTVVASNDNTSSSTGKMSFPGDLCSYVSVALQPGNYTVQVKGGAFVQHVATFSPGTFRLHVRKGS
jgi:hypothetical protein